MTTTSPNIIFEAADIENSTELMIIEQQGEFELHLVKDAGVSEDKKEFINEALVIKLDISDITRLIDVMYPYLKKEGLEI